MIETLTSLLALCGMLLAAYAVGRPVVYGLEFDREDWLAALVWSLAVGLVAVGMLLTCLGALGLLYRPLVGILTISGACVGLGWISRAYSLRNGLGLGSTSESISASDGPTPPSWLSRGVLALAAAAAMAALVSALAPSTDGDALCYHLELPKVFLQQHGLVHRPFNDYATFPLLVEMWYLWALAMDGPVAAQLVHWALGLLLALAAVLLATPILGRRWAWLAGGMVLLVPGISNQMTAALNDVGLAVFAMLSLCAYRRAVVDEDGRRWFLLAGWMLGAALAIKYTAMMFVVSVAATWLWSLWRQPQRRMLLVQGAALIAVVAVSLAGPWYLRAAWHRGNPVYPFFAEHLGQPARNAMPERKTPLTWEATSLLTAPWQVTLHPDRFGGRGHQLGALFLVTLPGLLVARQLRGLGGLLAVAVVYGLLWYELRQNVRFLFPLVPLLAVSVVWVWMEMRRFPPWARRAAVAVNAALLVFGALLPLYRIRDQWAVACGWETRESFLARSEPGYEIAEHANRHWQPRQRILSQDYRAFYFDGDVVQESVYRRVTGYDQQLLAPADLSDYLRDAGFTHLLLATAEGPGIRFNPRLSRLVEAEQQSGATDRFLQLASQRFVDADGTRRHYRLIELR